MQYGYFHVPQCMIEFITCQKTKEPYALSVYGLRYLCVLGENGQFPFAAEVFPWLHAERNPVIFFSVLRGGSNIPRMSQLWYNNGLVGMCLLGSFQPAVGIDPETKREIYLHDIDYWMEMGLQFDVPSFISDFVCMYIDHLNAYIYGDHDKTTNPHSQMADCITSNFKRCIAKCVKFMRSDIFYDIFDDIHWGGCGAPYRIFNIKTESLYELIDFLPLALPGPLEVTDKDFCCSLCGKTKTDYHVRWSDSENEEEEIIVKKVEGYQACLKCIISSMILREWFAPSLFDKLHNHLFKN